jgi:hypothetical protein
MAKKSATNKSPKLTDLKPKKDAKGGRNSRSNSAENPQRGVSALTLNHNETFLRN